MLETWKDIPEFENYYQASTDGRVRSLDRMIKNRFYPGQILKPSLTKYGYVRMTLRNQGRPKQYQVHRLVLSAFKGPCPKGLECCHNDGNKLNNRLDNLRWDTRTNNHADKRIHDTAQRGERHAFAKICELDVWLIRNIDAPQSQIAGFFGISQSNVCGIRTGKNWKHTYES